MLGLVTNILTADPLLTSLVISLITLDYFNIMVTALLASCSVELLDFTILRDTNKFTSCHLLVTKVASILTLYLPFIDIALYFLFLILALLLTCITLCVVHATSSLCSCSTVFLCLSLISTLVPCFQIKCKRMVRIHCKYDKALFCVNSAL